MKPEQSWPQSIGVRGEPGHEQSPGLTCLTNRRGMVCKPTPIMNAIRPECKLLDYTEPCCDSGDVNIVECLSRGCCYDASITGDVDCFKPPDMDCNSTPKGTSRQDEEKEEPKKEMVCKVDPAKPHLGMVCKVTPIRTSIRPECKLIDSSNREPCCDIGDANIVECLSRGCCYDASIPGDVDCFKPPDIDCNSTPESPDEEEPRKEMVCKTDPAEPHLGMVCKAKPI